MPGAKKPLALVVDANVILSAILRGRANLGFLSKELQLSTTAATLGEVSRYIPELSRKHRLPTDELWFALSNLPIRVWSNDNDFLDAGIQRLTTAEVLKSLSRP